jgi:hypothetical protein
VGFPTQPDFCILALSSSGGGLFGRPVILTNPGRFLILGPF